MTLFAMMIFQQIYGNLSKYPFKHLINNCATIYNSIFVFGCGRGYIYINFEVHSKKIYILLVYFVQTLHQIFV